MGLIAEELSVRSVILPGLSTMYLL